MLSEKGWQNAERLLARLRENGMTEALEGEVDRRLLHSGDPRPHVFLLRIIICAMSSRCLEHLYQGHDWFLVLEDDAGFAEMVWKVLLHEFRYRPVLTLNQFFRAERFADHKVAILIDVLRMVESLHNTLVQRQLRAERERRQRSELLRREAEKEVFGTRSPDVVLPRRQPRIRVADPPEQYPPFGPTPSRPVYKKTDPGTTTDDEEVQEPLRLIGGRLASSLEALEDSDSIVLRHREEHPQYHSALRGCGMVQWRRCHDIPGSSVVPLRRVDGTGLWALSNTQLPRHWTFGGLEPGTDFRCTLSGSDELDRDGSSETIAAFEKARQEYAVSEARRSSYGRVRVKGFPKMLARALLKLPRLAPASCPQEECDCTDFYAAHSAPRPPCVEGCGARSFWRERGSVIERTKERLRKKYHPREVVFVDAPEDVPEGSPRGSTPDWAALEESGREVLGMRWSGRRPRRKSHSQASPALPTVQPARATSRHHAGPSCGPNGGRGKQEDRRPDRSFASLGSAAAGTSSGAETPRRNGGMAVLLPERRPETPRKKPSPPAELRPGTPARSGRTTPRMDKLAAPRGAPAARPPSPAPRPSSPAGRPASAAARPSSPAPLPPVSGIERLEDGSYLLSAGGASELFGMIGVIPQMLEELQGLRREVSKIESQSSRMGETMERLGTTNDELRATMERCADDVRLAASMSMRSCSPLPQPSSLDDDTSSAQEAGRGVVLDQARRRVRRGGRQSDTTEPSSDSSAAGRACRTATRLFADRPYDDDDDDSTSSSTPLFRAALLKPARHRSRERSDGRSATLTLPDTVPASPFEATAGARPPRGRRQLQLQLQLGRRRSATPSQR
eukprot:TRINITY_DN47545_c0_g1_i1.p1 TRINITY_DN47545_c0_g1~~TRINITY_DN47545_c0_g1_i1.p1  ORF type:complete len:849 (+),score=230.47 TRINITY_DN47545_c0_g1_i1:71-2617(+)